MFDLRFQACRQKPSLYGSSYKGTHHLTRLIEIGCTVASSCHAGNNVNRLPWSHIILCPVKKLENG